MIAGDLSDYLIGLIVEREFGSQASLIVFLALYFLFLSGRDMKIAAAMPILGRASCY
jgi:hypothetical protein